LTASFSPLGWSSSGTEGASFLDIPVGAGPAALGSAYSAMATDAYAPTWNPAGLGFLRFPELAAMHVAYVENTAYEYASFVTPVAKAHSVGAAMQYFRPGTITATDLAGNSLGDISGYFAAYSLSYGQQLGKRLAIGVTGKLITGKIDTVTATSFGGDAGLMYKPLDNLTLAGVVANVGQKLKFLNNGDDLPTAYRVGAAYTIFQKWTLIEEVLYQGTGLLASHTGIQVQSLSGFSMRAGYKTETTKGLSPFAGVSLGLGLNILGQELSYAWVPLGDFGSTHYFSLLFKFGQDKKPSSLEQLRYYSEDGN